MDKIQSKKKKKLMDKTNRLFFSHAHFKAPSTQSYHKMFQLVCCSKTITTVTKTSLFAQCLGPGIRLGELVMLFNYLFLILCEIRGHSSEWDLITGLISYCEDTSSF